MKYFTQLLFWTWLFALPAVVLGATQKPKPNPLDQFTPTGKTEECLPVFWIQDAQVVDDRNILFRISGSKYYLNHLQQACPQLSLYKRFTYRLHSQDQLCNMDTITVLTDFSTSHGLLQGATCGLGKFEQLEKKAG